MSNINAGTYEVTLDIEKNAKGGTEQMTQRLAEIIDQDLLKEFFIVSSRVPDKMPEDKIRIFWAHDLPGDPMCDFMRIPHFRDRFHKYVFVSNWQMQNFISMYGLDWEKCIVLQNAIDPLENKQKDISDGIRLVYHSTPHRGLNILAAVFEELCKKYDNLTLDVYSSFNLYGWTDRDADYKDVFDTLNANPKVNYHGTADYETVKEAISNSHIFAYPSIWQETSCRCLMEAMSAGLICVHSNYGCLYETAANWTQMYGYNPDLNKHAAIFYNVLEGCISNIETMLSQANSQASYANAVYNWETRKLEWAALLQSLLNTVKDRSFPKEMFTIKTGT